MKTKKKSSIRFIGLFATIVGIGINLISDWVDEKKMDEMVEEKVDEALALRDKKEEEKEEES